MKECKDCHKTKRKSDFYFKQGECKKCTQKRVSANYHKNRKHYISYERLRELDPKRKALKLGYQKKRRAKSPGKNNARQKVFTALRNGTLKKGVCEVCGSPNTQAHHPDYRKYLQVRWLCRSHHMITEGKIPYEATETYS